MNDKLLLEAADFIKRAAPAKYFLEYLCSEREIVRSRLETVKGDQIYVEQGKAQQLTDLIQLIEGAEKTLEKQ